MREGPQVSGVLHKVNRDRNAVIGDRVKNIGNPQSGNVAIGLLSVRGDPAHVTVGTRTGDNDKTRIKTAGSP
jgi:hypothetical protein